MAKVLLSLDDRLLHEIDRAARANGETRSAYIVRLAKGDLARVSSRRLASTRGALARLDRLFEMAPAGDSTDEIRAERDAR